VAAAATWQARAGGIGATNTGGGAAGGRRPPKGAEAVLDAIAARLEEANLGAYVDLYRRPWRMLLLNFAAGTARGLGMAVGFTLLGAVVILLLRNTFWDNLPGIGHFVAEVVRIVQRETAPAPTQPTTRTG
jgi:hypothetical protein